MFTIIIRPCMLGFDVCTQAGTCGFIRSWGIFSASGLCQMLSQTEGNFTVVLK